MRSGRLQAMVGRLPGAAGMHSTQSSMMNLRAEIVSSENRPWFRIARRLRPGYTGRVSVVLWTRGGRTSVIPGDSG